MFGNQKGGVGKTTCTVLAANALSSPPFSFDVVVIDADQQQSISKGRLFDLQEHDGLIPYEIKTHNIAQFQKDIHELDKENDFIFIDVAGKMDSRAELDSQEISKYLQYVDYIFIPFVSGNFSLDSTLDYLKFVLQEKARRANTARPLEIIAFINMHRERRRSSKFLVSELDNLKQVVNIPFMDNCLSQYVLFDDTDTLESFYQESPTESAEQNLKKWIDELLNIATNKQWQKIKGTQKLAE